jgi:hypothetical protein
MTALLDVIVNDVIWEDSSLGPLAGEYHGKEAVGGGASTFGPSATVGAPSLSR